MRADIVPGARFPDYDLLEHTGRRRRLSDLQGTRDPKIVTITTDDLATTNTFRDEVGAPWPFLSDPERVVQQDLDIQEYTDPHHDPMIPYTLVLEPRLTVYKVYNGYWHWGRPSPERLRQDLCAVTQRIRPDWDITAPGMREAWEAGDRSRFFPYDV